MYDDYARQLINLIPDLPDIDRDECRRALSILYFYVVRSRLNIPTDEEGEEDLETARTLIRRMADTLESIAVFDRLYGEPHPVDSEIACAFVAAESIGLLSLSYDQTENNAISDPLIVEANYAALESGLLYMIGGYDSNAATITGSIDITESSDDDLELISKARKNNAIYALSRILSLCRSDIRQPNGYSPHNLSNQGIPSDYDTLLSEIRARLYHKLGSSVESYLKWLGGIENSGLESALTALTSLRQASVASGYPGYSPFSDIFHLSNLLIATIQKTSERSLMRLTQTPPTNANGELAQKFNDYIKHRAQGDDKTKGHPFLWPSALQYVTECLPGLGKDSVVSMPTGSGKSFLAELAIVNALSSGWVLYLTPTNALAHQVRRDLSNALFPFQSLVSIRAFVGNEEYTTLTEEQVNIEQMNFIAVMTPEKCALALRLYPEQFSNCSLCIFDECHLLQDLHRGVTVDILIAQLSIFAPRVRFLLMSAMVSNADELAEWLRGLHDRESIAITLKWRPSRTMRSLLVLNKDSLETNFEEAKTALSQLPPYRKKEKFPVELALIAGLSGPWSNEGSTDYRITRLPISFTAIASRGDTRPGFESWKNTASRSIAERFALANMPVICFMLTSKHHAFSSAEKSMELMPLAIPEEEQFPSLVEAWLSIADYELGVQTIIRRLLRHGVTVHTSALLNVEHSASEWMFINRKANLMFATGTLAQGLNLPAVAVIIAGTSMGDPRDLDLETPEGISRINAFILNGFGRAGRPGFSNQGIAVLVSDNPYSAEISRNLDPVAALERYPVLGESDAAIEVHSPVEKFLDDLISGEIDSERASKSELVLTSLLAESQDSGNVLSRTLAAYHKREIFTPQAIENAKNQISRLKEEFLQQPNVPDWMNIAAMKAGVEFFRAWRMWSAYMQRGLVSPENEEGKDICDWLQIFIEVMSQLPPRRITQYLPGSAVKRSTVLTMMRDIISTSMDVDTIPWEIPEEWSSLWNELMMPVQQYMKGESYASIAKDYLGLSQEDQITESRSRGNDPIPAVLNFVRDIVDMLAIDAGCFLAIQELVMHGGNNGATLLPETLQALPLCIRNGCDSLGSLSWYRFGYRQRFCAHALERAFPVPSNLEDDSARAAWVRNTRRDWLSGRLLVVEEPILDYAKTVLQEIGAT